MKLSILNLKTSNQEFLDFIVNEIHNAVVSTVDFQGKPSAQVCDLLMNKNNKLYIATSKDNQFFKNLINMPDIKIDGYKGDGTMGSCGFSITGKIKNINHQYLDEIFAKNLYLNDIYRNNLEQAKKDLRILEITILKADYLDHRTNPVFVRSFEF